MMNDNTRITGGNCLAVSKSINYTTSLCYLNKSDISIGKKIFKCKMYSNLCAEEIMTK